MQPANGTTLIDTGAPQRVRWSMLLSLGVIALAVVAQSWLSRQAEVSRSTDAEIISLAGIQRTHSQRIARLAYQSASDTAQIELDMVLLGLEAQALELERLLAAQGIIVSDQGLPVEDELAPFAKRRKPGRNRVQSLWPVSPGSSRPGKPMSSPRFHRPRRPCKSRLTFSF